MKSQNPSLQFPSVYAVQASAGSGKTYTLAKRYLELLLNIRSQSREVPLRNILAITFTNKAAIEMKERILMLLKMIALDKFKDTKEGEELLSLGPNPMVTREKACQAMEEIIRNYNFFQVQTIDSFINSLLYACAYRLRLSSSFKVRKDFNRYLTLSLDELIDTANHDTATQALFENFLKQYLYLENKTGWFPKRDILSIIFSLYSTHNIHTGDFKKFDIEKSELFSKKKLLWKKLQMLNTDLPETTNKTFKKSLEKFLNDNDDLFSLDEVPNGLSNVEFPANKGASVSMASASLWKDIRMHLKEACEIEALSLFNCYIDIFTAAYRNFLSFSHQQDVLFLEELNKHARSLFGDNPVSTPELYYRLSSRLNHFLIDEFQDTSVLQWTNISTMIEEALSIEGSLFFVGDKKQAIFRFRGGEAGLFKEIEDKYRDRLQTRTLTNNYRSQKEIVDFNNAIFSRDNISRFVQRVNDEDDEVFGENDISEILEIFSDSHQTYNPEHNKGYVRVECIESQELHEAREIIQKKLITQIKELTGSGRFGLKDIAVIARRNDEVALLSQWLLEVDIPVESEKTLNIRENTLIKEAISFFKFLESPIDNLFFASFILGDIFLKASGMIRQEAEDFIAGLKIRERRRDSLYIYKEFRIKFSHVWDSWLESFYKSAGFVPLYELVVAFYDTFDVFNNFPDSHGFFMRLLELVKDQEQDHPTLGSFLEYFDEAVEEELYVNVVNTEAVKVLTIHKAKGLEFDVVIIPFLEVDIKIGSATGSGGHTYVIDHSQGGHIRLLKIKKKKYTEFSKVLKNVYQREYRKAFIDELNNIYVSLTRAKNELYVYIPKKVSAKGNQACYLISDERVERGVAHHYGNVNTQEQALCELIPACRKDWVALLADEFESVASIQNEHVIKHGKMFHEILSYIGNLEYKESVSAIEDALRKAGRLFIDIDRPSVLETVNALIKSASAKQFFWVKNAEVYCEKEIIDAWGNSKRIDRLIVRADSIEVIDYKSSHDDRESQREQVLEYMMLVQEIYPMCRVRGFLIYLDDSRVEEVCVGSV